MDVPALSLFQAWVDRIKVPQASEGRFPKPGILHDMVTRNSKYPNYNLMSDFVHLSVPTAAIALIVAAVFSSSKIHPTMYTVRSANTVQPVMTPVSLPSGDIDSADTSSLHYVGHLNSESHGSTPYLHRTRLMCYDMVTSPGLVIHRMAMGGDFLNLSGSLDEPVELQASGALVSS